MKNEKIQLVIGDMSDLLKMLVATSDEATQEIITKSMLFKKEIKK